MKKLLLTFMSVLIIFTSTCLSLQAEETTITKTYLKDTLGMSDEEILSSGLGYVYELGDEVTVKLHTDEDLECGNNINIPSGTTWNIVFEVAGKGVDRADGLTLITKDALPIGAINLDSTNEAIRNTVDMWYWTFLHDNIYSMFGQGLKARICKTEKRSYQIAKNGDVLKDLAVDGVSSLGNAYPLTYVWLPSAKELGYGDTYTVNKGNATNVVYNNLGSVYPLYQTEKKNGVVKAGENDVNYWLREMFLLDNETYFFNTTNENSIDVSKKTDKTNGLVIGVTVTFSEDALNNVVQNSETVTGSSTIAIDAYEPSSYAVDLPERVTLTQDFTQFEYTVTGDIEKNKVVRVDFPKTSKLTYDGGFYKKDIVLNIFNGQMTYDRFDCAIDSYQTGTTTKVSIKNKAPSAGKWKGSLPVTISLEDAITD